MSKLKPKEWVLIRPGEEGEHIIHDEDLKWMQAQVGGYVELVHVDWKGRMRKAYVNEEAKLRGTFQVNLVASRLYRQQILGNMLIEVGRHHGG